jgi:hypothetical protein
LFKAGLPYPGRNGIQYDQLARLSWANAAEFVTITGMMSLLTSKWRWRAASVLVAVYAFCLLAPAAAMAVGSGAAAAHCLNDDHHGLAKVHVHHDGSSHSHSIPKADDHAQPSQCCGLFCLSAVAPAFEQVVAASFAAPDVAATVTASLLFGCGSNRIDRPPRSLLSL